MNYLLLFFLTFTSISLPSQSMNDKDISMYPAPKKGMKQAVIYLDKKEKEEDFKVEIFAVKSTKVDNCNSHTLTGSFEELNLQGWGYNYLSFNTKGHIMSTRMGCQNNELVETKVKSSGYTTRYNSRSPIVVYCPIDCNVQYRFWTTTEDTIEAVLEK